MFQINFGRNTEVDKFYQPFLQVHQYIKWIDIFMNNAIMMNLTYGLGDGNGDIKKINNIALFFFKCLTYRLRFNPL
ncbi:MAG: hypothetical protein WCH01_02235 [Methylococcaceae bacterium]